MRGREVSWPKAELGRMFQRAANSLALQAGSAVGKDRPLSQKQDLLLEDDCFYRAVML